MSEDPKGFDAGDYNLFRYCHNDPEDLTDPMGLAPVEQFQEKVEVTGSHIGVDASSLDRLLAGRTLAGLSTTFGRAFESAHDFTTVITGQGGEGHGGPSARSKYPPPLPNDLLAMKEATDKSGAAMHKDPEGYPYTVTNGTGGQGQPGRGIRHVVAGFEVFEEHAGVRGDLQSVGHVHKPGTL